MPPRCILCRAEIEEPGICERCQGRSQVRVRRKLLRFRFTSPHLKQRKRRQRKGKGR